MHLSFSLNLYVSNKIYGLYLNINNLNDIYFSGAPGAIGANGSAGATGVAGHAGCTGNTGATGHMGSAGAPGNNMSLDIIARMRD